MYRVNVTTLESFRRYIAGVSPADTEERLIEKLSGRFLGNKKTTIGSAFHGIIEDGFKKVIQIDPGKFFTQTVTFNRVQVDAANRYRKQYLDAVREVPLFKEYKVPRLGEILVTGKTDQVHGRTLRDTKTKFTPVVYQEYQEAYQWRFYLDMIGLDVFYYDFFEFIGYDEDKNNLDVSGCTINEWDPLRCDRYDSLETDVQGLVRDFLEYIHDKNFYHYLKPATNEKDPFF